MTDVAQVLRGPEPEPQENVGGTERWVSTLAGAGLALAGVMRGTLGGALVSLAGAALIHRGLTGHCAVYGALNVNTANRVPRHAPRGADRWHTTRSLVPGGPAGAVLGQTRTPDKGDQSLAQTFPASDAPAFMGSTAHAGAAPKRSSEA